CRDCRAIVYNDDLGIGLVRAPDARLFGQHRRLVVIGDDQAKHARPEPRTYIARQPLANTPCVEPQSRKASVSDMQGKHSSLDPSVQLKTDTMGLPRFHVLNCAACILRRVSVVLASPFA